LSSSKKQSPARKNITCTVDKTNPSETDPEHKLIADLMKNYDLDARPVLNKSKPVDVSFDLAFNQIIELVVLHSL
jgi:hypothetical protein